MFCEISAFSIPAFLGPATRRGMQAACFFVCTLGVWIPNALGLSGDPVRRAELAEGAKHGFFNRSPWLERTMYRVDEFLASLGYVSGKPTVKLPQPDNKKQ